MAAASKPELRRSDFDFHLPEALIARYPLERRDGSRLLVLDRSTGALRHCRFSDLPQLLDPHDVLVVNDTKVLPARFHGRKAVTGGKVELLLVEPIGGGDEAGRVDGVGVRVGADSRARPGAHPPGETRRFWRAMAQASKAIKPGTRILLSPRASSVSSSPPSTPSLRTSSLPFAADADIATSAALPEVRVVSVEGDGFVVVELPADAESLAQDFGTIPLPPYLGRSAEPDDTQRYQTIYASSDKAQSVAAPTAGLHFTPEVFEALRARGIGRAEVTLHVGPGTFLPMRAESLDEHRMHGERFEVGEEAAAQIAATQASGHRVVAVGSTSTRVLEAMGRPIRAGRGSTDIFIRPGHAFSNVDALLTNFHLPCSTLLVLVAAFADHAMIMNAYAEAVREGYRFFSYGDAMLIL
ncbi:MAG: tRNA preQ1(34) S-adenosylmethionine ribosyltransferase-isomerase QueA [Deltaproteobacteria bacterium]|nr:tRNA preQ1(34) S-adenosylmethionine ribosyltransferase-isomerase QueA [Deltaproteobacteria bacterium]